MRNQKGQGAKAPHPPAGAAFVRKEKVVPKWLYGEKLLPVETLQSQLLDDQVAVVVVHKNRVIELVYHHPIGRVSGTTDEDWVLTDTGEIQTLLARRENPDKQAIELLRSNWITEQLVGAGLLKREDDGTIHCVHESLRVPGGRKAVLKQFKADPPTLTTVQLAALEREEAAITDFRRDRNLRAESEKKFPDQYETAAGPLKDRVQSPLEPLKGLPGHSIVDGVIRLLYDGNLLGGASAPTKVGTTGKPSKGVSGGTHL